MPRGRGNWDVVLEGDGLRLGFQLAFDAPKPAVEPFDLSPARLDEQVLNADQVRVIDNLGAGMGYSRRVEQVPNGYDYCLPGYTRAAGALFQPAGRLTPVAMPSDWTITDYSCSARFDGQIFVGSERNVCQLSADGTSATTVYAGGPDFYAHAMEVFNNKLYVAGRQGGLASRAVGGTWTAENPNVPCWGLATANWRPQGIPTDVLLTLFDNTDNWSHLRWCTITRDPMDPLSWSAPIVVGADRRYVMGPIVAAPRHVYIFGRDGVYDIDELGTRAFNIAPWLAENQDTRNGHWGMHVGTGLYYGHSAGLAFVETSGETQYQPEWAQPGWGLPYEGPVSGLPLSGTLQGGWGMVGLFWPGVWPPIPGLDPALPSETYLCAGRRVAGPNPTLGPTHIWHGAEQIVPGAVTTMRVYTNDWNDGWPSVLILAHGGTGVGAIGQTYWHSLPKFGNPLQEMIWGGKFQPADESKLFLGADGFGRASTVKTMLEIDLLADRLQLGSDVLKVYAAVDGSDWVDQGSAEEYVYTTLAPSPALEGRYISSRVDMTGSPVLRSLELRAAMGVELREARTYRVILAWDNALRGARSRETADPERRLYDLQHLLGRICTIEDSSTTEPRRVRVLQVGSGERMRLGGPRRAAANGSEGAWAIVVSILVSFLDKPFRWDGPPSDVFDVDRTWR